MSQINFSKRSIWESKEFMLVVILLFFMTVILLGTIFLPFPEQKLDDSVTWDTIIDFRRELFSAVITAFAAWIGAGSAYFFGRENFREAVQAITGKSARELLREKKLGEVMRPVEAVVKISDTIKTAFDKVLTDPQMWFVIGVDAKGLLSSVVHEDAIQRYITDKMKASDAKANELYEKIRSESTIKDVIDHIKTESTKIQKLSQLIDIQVTMKMDDNCVTAQEKMDENRKRLTIVVNDKGIPIGYITTGDIRKIILQD